MLTEQEQEIVDEYERLCHAMQTGVKMVIEFGASDDHNPKHLRTGLNSVFVEKSAVAKLLMAKGIFTQLEYFTALRDGMKEEVDRYEAVISTRIGTGKKVTLI